MRVPLSWLRELVDVPADNAAAVDALAATLDDLGLVVEEIHRPATLSGVVAARVQECREIAGAENVQLVLVDDGDGRREVVCGAFNFGPGDKVPLARPGAVLPDGRRIETRTIKSLGVTSHGMLCAPDEIGAGHDHSGILVLAPDAPLGAPVDVLLGLDETVIELEITPNRPDCMSVVGVAREVAAAHGLPLHLPDTAVATTGARTADLATVDVVDPAGCDRYVAMVVEGVTIGPSPEWMTRRLTAAGMRPLNNVVDVTNYVLLELGQPLHAFDLDRLAGHHVEVRRAAAGETMTTLDGVARPLSGDDLLICDEDGPVAVAGVMGGSSSEVSATTTRILLESAHFDPPSVLQTSKRLGLRTESSARFERGTDPGVCVRAAGRAAALMAEVAGGEVRPAPVDTRPEGPAPVVVAMRPARVNRLLGTDILPERMTELLAGIGIEETVGREKTDGARFFTVPSWRPDLEREADLAEEVARLHGYNNVPRSLPAARGKVGGLSAHQAAEAALRAALLATGTDEAATLSFVSVADYAPLGWVDVPRVELANPLREEERYLRTSLVPMLLGAVAYNAARRARSVCLWEMGAVFSPTGGDGVDEARMLAVVLAGDDDVPRVHTGGRSRLLDVYDVKGVLEAVCETAGTVPAVDPAGAVPPGLHPDRCGAVLLDGEPAGFMGELHPDAVAALDLPYTPAVFEVALAPLLEARVRRADVYVAASVYPASFYDLAFLVGEEVPAGDLAATLADAGAPLCRAVEPFDVFRSEQITPGRKSVAFEARFQAHDRTLTDAEVAGAVAHMVAAVEERFGARLRTV